MDIVEKITPIDKNDIGAVQKNNTDEKSFVLQQNAEDSSNKLLRQKAQPKL
jgi:hypothetical protein